MKNNKSQIITRAVERILTPLFRLLIHYQIDFEKFIKIAQKTYYQVAKQQAEEINDDNWQEKTGLTGENIKAIEKQITTTETNTAPSDNIVARVISGWLNDSSYANKISGPFTLPYDLSQGEQVDDYTPCFVNLVKRYAENIPAEEILMELLTHQIVMMQSNEIKLIKYSYIPDEDEEKKIVIFGEHGEAMLETSVHNILSQDEPFAEKMVYEIIPQDNCQFLRNDISMLSQKLLLTIDKTLTAANALSKARSKTKKVKAGIGVYYFEQDLTNH